MYSLTSLLCLLGVLALYANATALTYKMVPNEKECFYTQVDKPGVKIAFYFAVQSGGSFDSTVAHARAGQRAIAHVLTVAHSRLRSVRTRKRARQGRYSHTRGGEGAARGLRLHCQ